MFNFAGGKWRWYAIAAAGLGCAAAVLLVWWRLNRSVEDDSSEARSLDTASTSLRETVIVPTLDSPLPEGKSAIWCASFQLAWDRLKKDVADGPVEVQNAEAVAARLNAAEFPEGNLDPTTFYAAAGLARDDIPRRITTEMKQRFPAGPTPELNPAAEGAVAYAYLRAGVKYSYPYFDNDEAFTFTDQAGKQTRVRSFGIRKKDDYAYRRLRDQVKVLYCPQDAIMSEKEIEEFVVDPCKDSQPHQLVLARVDRKATLAATLADVEKKIKDQPTTDFTSRLHPRDTLLVPGMSWRISHHFAELEGKDRRLLNAPLQGLYLDTALQTIDFRMDRGGAELAAQAKFYVKPGASYFEFNRPFLVLMKKRGGKQPFFVLWVENAELMRRW
jgi:hypothetical protein